MAFMDHLPRLLPACRDFHDAGAKAFQEKTILDRDLPSSIADEA
jgi:hypothetical protein